MNRNTHAYRIATWLVVALLSCGGTVTATALEDKSASTDQSASPKSGAIAESPMKSKADLTLPPSLVIYRLKYADPQSAVAVLRAGLGLKDSIVLKDHLIFDPKTSALIVEGSRGTHRNVEDILKQLDVPAVQEPEQPIKVFTLLHADPAAAAKALSTIGPKGLKMSIDERTRSIIVAGSSDALNVAEALLMKLDEQGATSVARYEVRVIWLAGGLAGEGKGEPPADDLKDVVAELSRLGIKDPRQVGQMVVQTTSGGSYRGMFEVKSSPRFGDQRADFNASGLLSQRFDGPGLVMQISLRTRKESSPPDKNVNENEIETQIILPQKQYVVLATAPTGDLTSIFVVQVTEVTKGPDKKGNR